jgi:hypothetical protein
MFDPFTGTVLAHLLRHRFMPGYTQWIHHGEENVADDEEGGNNDIESEEEGNEGGNEEAPEHDQD